MSAKYQCGGNGKYYEPSNLTDILEWLCKAPTVTTYRVNVLKTTTANFKDDIQTSYLTKYDRKAEIFSVDGLNEMVCIPAIENIKTEMEIDSSLNEIIVDCSCGAALLRGAHIYAPGVLAMQSGTKIDEIVNVFADLEGKCKKGTSARYESELKIFIGTGLVKLQRYQLYGDNLNPQGVAVEMLTNLSNVPSIGDLSSPKALLQNLPSIVCVTVLDPIPGEHILDMCSAPGNKTTHIAEKIGDKGVIIALDKTEGKIRLVRKKVEDYGLKSILPFAFDSTKSLKIDHIGDFLKGPPFSPNTFDKILLDAPCSALGNRPLLTNNLSPKMLDSYPPVQKKLFANAVGLLKPGGVLVYSTCTIAEAENEGIVRWAKEKFPQMKLIPAEPYFGGLGIEDAGLSEEERTFVQRFGPKEYNRGSDIDSVGFFIAKFVKLFE